MNTPLIMLPNRRTMRENVRVICSTMLSGIMIHVGSAKVREVAEKPSRADPVEDGRAKDDRAEGGIGLQMSGRRLDARDQR